MKDLGSRDDLTAPEVFMKKRVKTGTSFGYVTGIVHKIHD